MNLISEDVLKNNKKLSSHFEQHILIEEDGSVIKKRNKELLRNANDLSVRDSIVSTLSSDIGVVLSTEFDDLPTHKITFKTEIKKIFSKIINNIMSKDERVIFIDIQMYSVFIIKKQSSQFDEKNQLWFVNEKVESIESNATNKIIEEYRNKNPNGKIIKIEYVDILFVFFPTQNMKKTLKELGFYDL